MTELPVSALDPRLQNLAESAQAAFEQGDDDRAVAACGDVLREAPGCLAVRKLLRATQRRRAEEGGGLLAIRLGGVTAVPFLLSGRSALKSEPLMTVAAAEKAIAAGPCNPAGHRLLAEAADALGWRETAVFAWESALDTDPGDPELMLGLGEAQLAAGNPAGAAGRAQRALRLDPHNPRAQRLLKDATLDHSCKQDGGREDGGHPGKLRKR